MSLAELDHWDPGSIHAVFAAVQTHADSTREIANSLKQVVNAVPWEGAAHDAALAAKHSLFGGPDRLVIDIAGATGDVQDGAVMGKGLTDAHASTSRTDAATPERSLK